MHLNAHVLFLVNWRCYSILAHICPPKFNETEEMVYTVVEIACPLNEPKQGKT